MQRQRNKIHCILKEVNLNNAIDYRNVSIALLKHYYKNERYNINFKELINNTLISLNIVNAWLTEEVKIWEHKCLMHLDFYNLNNIIKK